MTAVCSIAFSGIAVRILLPDPVPLSDELAALQCNDPVTADAEYEVHLLTSPLSPDGPLVHTQGDMQLYRTSQGWLRIHSALTAKDGCQVACLLCPNGNGILYYPASRWARYSSPFHCTNLLCGETLLLRHNAFLLHSSVVQVHGKTVLFSAPSGIGKSTQAELWRLHAGADILNGDRCVVMQRPDGFYGGGSPWSGTSGIYRREQAPIAGIFLLEQAPENRVTRLGAEAFSPLFRQTTINSWDPAFMDRILQLYDNLLSQVPVYRLQCRPDRDAVGLAYHTLFGKEASPWP